MWLARVGAERINETILAETTTTELSKVYKPQGLEGNKKIARRGSNVAGDARKSIEADTGKSVLSDKKASDFNELISDIITGILPEEKNKK